MKVTKQQLTSLKESLLYLHMEELREVCTQLTISCKGKKGLLTERILYFLSTGKVLQEVSIPLVSHAQKGTLYSLRPTTLILKGSYKNDLKTRNFFKSLIGDHFHFTAFGIDWINERWLAGKPPTYQEYATMWQQEYERRKFAPATPKEEWKYINFIQEYMKKYPNASRSESLQAWETERQKQVKNVEIILKTLGNL